MPFDAAKPMRILAISGSLRALSSNKAALQAAALLAPPGVAIALYEGLGGLPHFNPDLDGDRPPLAIQTLRREIARSDGLLICSPEYAHGVAGALKNALDWLVSCVEFPGKAVALINTSARASHAHAQLREILATMSARLIEPASIVLALPPGSHDAKAIVANLELAAQIRDALDEFAAAILAAETEARV
jgi:chromate reductase, NAD(P)H dehydrogenase (quinone)